MADQLAILGESLFNETQSRLSALRKRIVPNPTVPLNEGLRSTLAEVRKELLDFGLRNPLLNYRLLKSRGLEIAGVRPAEAYQALVILGRELSFLSEEDMQEAMSPVLFD